MFSRWLWERLTISGVKSINVYRPHRLASDDDSVQPIPIERRWPGLAGTPIIFAQDIPRSDRPTRFQHATLQFILQLKEYIGLTASYPEPYKGIGAPFPKDYLALNDPPDPPALPDDFAANADWSAGLAWRGPFSILTSGTNGGFEIDMGHIEKLPVREGLLRSGGKAHFIRDNERLKTAWIEQEGKRHLPGSSNWQLAEKRFLVGMNTQMTFIEHLVNLHLITAGTFVIATLEALPTRNPLRALLQPFVEGTILVNNNNIDGLIKTEHSNVPSYTGHPLNTVYQTISQVASAFDLRTMDPVWRAQSQNTLDQGFITIQSRIDIFKMFQKLSRRYCHEVLITLDPEVRAWTKLLDKYIPNGIMKLIEIEDWQELNLDHVAQLVAVLAYSASVSHHLVADMVRDYMMSFHIMPPAIDVNGFPRLGIVLEKMNSISVASIIQYKLLDKTCKLPEKGQDCWDEFQTSLTDYQATVDAANHQTQPYLIHPKLIPSSIHA